MLTFPDLDKFVKGLRFGNPFGWAWPREADGWEKSLFRVLVLIVLTCVDESLGFVPSYEGAELRLGLCKRVEIVDELWVPGRHPGERRAVVGCCVVLVRELTCRRGLPGLGRGEVPMGAVAVPWHG